MRYLIGLSLGTISALVLSGCATEPDHYDRQNTTLGQFQQDFAGCKLAAMGVPQQHTDVNVYTAHTYVTGHSVTTTVGPDPYAQLGAALGDAITNYANHANAVHLCMQSQGYALRKKR